MVEPVMLDSTPLGKLAHPRPNAEIANWFRGVIGSGMIVIVPELADYEVRREFLRVGLRDALCGA